MPTNVNDLSVTTRQQIADKANQAGLTAEQVKTQLNRVGVTETNSVAPTPPKLPTIPNNSANSNPSLATESPVVKNPITPGVGIPGVNIPPYKDTTGTTTSSTTTANPPDGTTDSTGTALAEQADILKKQQAGTTKESTQAEIDKKKAEDEKYLSELQKNKEEQIKILENTKSEKDKLERDTLNREQDLLNKQNKSLQNNLNASLKDLEAQKASQAIVDQNSQIQFQREAEAIRLNTARWGDRIGLNFSSAGVSTFQALSENALLGLETLKSKAVQNQTSLTKEIVATRSKYEDDVNTNIDKFLDIVDKNKSDAIDRINSLNTDKLKTSEEILTEKKKVADEFRIFIKTTEDSFKTEQRQLAEDLVNNTEKIRLNSERIKTKNLEDLGARLETGELSRLTPAEIAQFEKDNGLPVGTIQLKKNQGIKTTIRAELDNLAGSNYYPENFAEIIDKVNEDMASGYSLEDAIQNRVGELSQTDPKLQDAIDRKSKQLTKEEIDLLKVQNQNNIDWAKIGVENNKLKSSDSLGWAKLDLEGNKLSADMAYKNATLSQKESELNLKGAQFAEDYGVDIGSVISNNKRTGDNLQCGQLVNDTYQQLTGSSLGLGNSYQSKVDAVNKIGASDTPQVGGIFASNPLGNSIGHTGIITAVNEDGSVEIAEANAEGKETGGPVVSRTIPANQLGEYKFSQSIQPTQALSVGDKTTDYNKMSLYNLQKLSGLGVTDRGFLIKTLENKDIEKAKEEVKQTVKQEEANKKANQKRLYEGDPDTIKSTIEVFKSNKNITDGLRSVFKFNPKLGNDMSSGEAGQYLQVLQNTISYMQRRLTGGLAQKKDTENPSKITNQAELDRMKQEVLGPILKEYDIYIENGNYYLKQSWLEKDINIFDPSRGDWLFNKLNQKVNKKVETKEE